MQNLRKDYFPANDCVVITGLCPNGQYGAYRDQDDGRVRGYGHTRLAAIADLVEAIAVEGSIYEREPENIREVSLKIVERAQ